MKIFKIVTDSGFSIELSVDENYGVNAYMVIRDTNSADKEGLSVELTNDECCEVLDFMEIIQDQLEINNFIDENPSEFTEDQYNYLKSKDWSYKDPDQIGTSAVYRDSATAEFPDPDDIQAWLSKNQDDNSEENED